MIDLRHEVRAVLVPPSGRRYDEYRLPLLRSAKEERNAADGHTTHRALAIRGHYH